MIKKDTLVILSLQRTLTTLLLWFVFSPDLLAQPPVFRTYIYIEKYSALALQQMVEYRIPASVTLAQAILESRSGTSELARRSNNHFGIKCHSSWVGDTIIKDDDLSNECFRRYQTVEDSYNDHSIFLSSRNWYAPLFKLPVTDYKSWCKGLKAAGYATLSTYADELIKVIEDSRLFELDGAEVLLSKEILVKARHTLRISPYSLTPQTFQAFANSDLLFSDEKDILIQSLHLNLSGTDEAEISIAEK